MPHRFAFSAEDRDGEEAAAAEDDAKNKTTECGLRNEFRLIGFINMYMSDNNNNNKCWP